MYDIQEIRDTIAVEVTRAESHKIFSFLKTLKEPVYTEFEYGENWCVIVFRNDLAFPAWALCRKDEIPGREVVTISEFYEYLSRTKKVPEKDYEIF